MNARHSNPSDSSGTTPPSACERLLCLPLTQPIRAEAEFIRLLDSTQECPPDRNIMFDTLEQVRGSLCFVREASARQYLEEAPYLDTDRERLFQQGVEATRRMMSGYAGCANLEKTGAPAGLAASPGRARQVATVLHRSLYYSGMLIFEHYRAKRELPAGIWARHHALFAAAERLAVASLQIEDRLFDETRTSHCQAAFVAPLLAEQACPYGRSPRDLNFIWCWAERLAADVQVRPLAERPQAAAFGIDLEQDAPLRAQHLIDRPGSSRWLDTGAATSRLRRILDQLAKGVPAERLGLCEDGIEPAKALLEQLILLWSLETPQRRQHSRVAGKGSLVLCAGFQAMHHAVLAADPHPACVAQLRCLDKNPHRRPPEEPWELLDSAAGGFRLACPATTLRLMPRQLLAVRMDDGAGYRLGRVAWLKREQRGRLVAGIALLGGRPQAVAVRPLSPIHGEKSTYQRAFLLRGEREGDPATSLLLPIALEGKAGKMEVVYDQHRHLSLGREIERGADFVHVGVAKS